MEWAAAAREWVGGVDEELERAALAVQLALFPGTADGDGDGDGGMEQRPGKREEEEERAAGKEEAWRRQAVTGHLLPHLSE